MQKFGLVRNDTNEQTDVDAVSGTRRCAERMAGQDVLTDEGQERSEKVFGGGVT